MNGRKIMSISQKTYKKLDIPGYREEYPDKSDQEILEILLTLGCKARSMGCYTEEIVDNLTRIPFRKLKTVAGYLYWLRADDDTRFKMLSGESGKAAQ